VASNRWHQASVDSETCVGPYSSALGEQITSTAGATRISSATRGPVHPRRLLRAIMLNPSRDRGTGTLDVGAWPVRAAYAAAPSLPPAFQPSQQKRGGHRGGVRRTPESRQCRADQVAAAIPELAHIDAGSPPVTSSWRRTLGALRRDGSARPPPHRAGVRLDGQEVGQVDRNDNAAYSNGTAEERLEHGGVFGVDECPPANSEPAQDSHTHRCWCSVGGLDRHRSSGAAPQILDYRQSRCIRGTVRSASASRHTT
jgi:hypothetical protein